MCEKYTHNKGSDFDALKSLLKCLKIFFKKPDILRTMSSPMDQKVVLYLHITTEGKLLQLKKHSEL